MLQLPGPTQNNFTLLNNTSVCSAIEFNGLINQADNTLTNYTFLCWNQAAPAKWAASLSGCSGVGQQNCGGGCCATRNGTLFGSPMTLSSVCQANAANSGPQIMYGYANPLDVAINYGWGQIDSNCKQAGRVMAAGMWVIVAAAIVVIAI